MQSVDVNTIPNFKHATFLKKLLPRIAETHNIKLRVKRISDHYPNITSWSQYPNLLQIKNSQPVGCIN